MTPKTGVVPPGGHHFIEKHGDTERRIEGGSYDEVAERLLRYRVTNGLPLGQPKVEVEQYVCSNWPHFCSDRAPVDSPVSSAPGFVAGVTMWLQQLNRRQASVPEGLVSEAEANRRAEICRGCPMQKSWHEGCGLCIATVERQSLLFRADKKVSNAKDIQGCSVLFQENHAAAWAHKDALPEVPAEQLAQLPSHCWRR